MIGFLTVFVAASLAFAIVIQGFYQPQPLFEKARFVDEFIGGALGLVQAAVILGAFDHHPRLVLPAERQRTARRSSQFLRDSVDVPRYVAGSSTSSGRHADPGVLRPVRVPHPDKIKAMYPAAPS